MKNIHILPTDKPSRLFRSFGKLNIEDYITERENTHIKNQNIYITSDEYIGLSYYLDGNLIRKGVVDDKDYWEVRKDYKKIILTTDQDLIKDGVQAINDEFLEWFVKNPSCEEVEVHKICYGALSGFADAGYKIIISKEEAKQDNNWSESTGNITSDYFIAQSKAIQKCMLLDAEMAYNSLPKQETLEEAAEIFVKNRFAKQICNDESYPDIYASKFAIVESHILFAKWQSERSYSEEDMKICWQEATEDMRKQFSTSYSGMTFEKFIEHYKK